ncbi:single-strand DNA-binding protein [Bacilli bacterium PM5-3]|nr:single-strand DNA-binding protein [Bacilli bacterium PM5-3]MDH6604041.1 single-strand DNA-binding protein [Bacilli bacterium PM5-9]
MLNQIVVVGRLVKDPVINETQDGKKLANITLAVQRSFKNIEGNYEVDFIDCVLWKGIAESTANYCAKGSVIGIKGRLMTSLYKNNEGSTCKNVEVVAEKVSFLGYPSREKPKEPTNE